MTSKDVELKTNGINKVFATDDNERSRSDASSENIKDLFLKQQQQQ